MYYKFGQACVTNWGSFVLLRVRANVVTNWGSFIITNCGICCYKLGKPLQIRITVFTKQVSYYKLGQNALQIGAGITNQGNYSKLGHNSVIEKKGYLIVSLVVAVIIAKQRSLSRCMIINCHWIPRVLLPKDSPTYVAEKTLCIN